MPAVLVGSDHRCDVGRPLDLFGGLMARHEPPGWDAEPREAASFQVVLDHVPPVGTRMMMVVFRRPDDELVIDFAPSETGYWVVIHAERTVGALDTVTVHLRIVSEGAT